MKVAFDTPSAGQIASATTEYPSAEAVSAKLIKAACVACPISLGNLSQRKLIIERVYKDGTIASSASYAIPQKSGADRELEFIVDAAFLPKAAVRARIDTCGPSETQWVLINYDFEAV